MQPLRGDLQPSESRRQSLRQHQGQKLHENLKQREINGTSIAICAKPGAPSEPFIETLYNRRRERFTAQLGSPVLSRLRRLRVAGLQDLSDGGPGARKSPHQMGMRASLVTSNIDVVGAGTTRAN